MRELFAIDKKNYIEGGSTFVRPSVRGIIIRDGKIAMIHSLKFNYYKLPGGGIEAGEKYEDTLIREVKEESGLTVKPESIREFGYVRRKEKGKIDDIFIQDNYYFLCEAEAEVGAQNLDAYEDEERFTLEWVTPEVAIETNTNADHGNKVNSQTFAGMMERENRVLRMVIEEIL